MVKKKNIFAPKKNWYKSKTIWACTASLVIAVLSGMYGEASWGVTFAITIASALGIYGRKVAKTEIQ